MNIMLRSGFLKAIRTPQSFSYKQHSRIRISIASYQSAVQVKGWRGGRLDPFSRCYATVDSPHNPAQLGKMSLPKTFEIQLADGKKGRVPTVGFGTWAFSSSPVDPADPKWIKEGLRAGLDAGYRHIEGAWFYGVSMTRKFSNT